MNRFRWRNLDHFIDEILFLMYYSHEKFSSKKLSDGIRHLSSALTLAM